jgi:phosphoribosylaminoimidazolecarboxamide formyltransferase/IMP cyclohydrolase
MDVKRVGSGLLMQTADNHELALADLKVVTKKQPTPQELQDLLFAWKVAKYVKSNAIVFCKDGMTMGVGAGQMSRIDSARIASIKAAARQAVAAGHGGGERRLLPVPRRAGRGGGRGRDLRDPAGRQHARPGSDRRGDERGVAMVFTGVRHFRH